jgi:WD40 repeat protein
MMSSLISGSIKGSTQISPVPSTVFFLLGNFKINLGISNVDSNNLALGCQNGTVAVYSMNSGQLVGQHREHKDQVSSLISFAVKNSSYVCSSGHGTDPRIFVWDIAHPGPFLQLEGHSSSVTCMTIADSPRNLISGGADNSLIIWDLVHTKKMQKLDAHNGTVSGIRYLPTINTIATAGWDNYIKLWGIETSNDEFGKFVNNLNLCQSFDNGSSVLSMNSCQIDSTFLLAGSSNHRITVWNLSTGQRENELETNTTANEIVLVENKFTFCSPDFMVLNTNSLDDPVGGLGGPGPEANPPTMGFNPRVQLLEMDTEKAYSLKLAKVGNVNSNGYCVNIYDII